MRKAKRYFWTAVCLFVAFVLWTAMVCIVDVQGIGPQESRVGLATMNQWFHHLTGVHLSLYFLTDWLSLIPLVFVAVFGLLGLMQWIQRKSIWKVDFSILALGGFYLLVLAAFVFFELFPVNYRPILIDGVLEASYPSSTTMLVLCVMPTAILQLRRRMKNSKAATILLALFTVFMLIGRALSGVHWLSDIVGGILLSGSLVLLYYAVCCLKKDL